MTITKSHVPHSHVKKTVTSLDRFDQAALHPKKYTNASFHQLADTRTAGNPVENGVEAVIGGLTDDHSYVTRPGNHAV